MEQNYLLSEYDPGPTEDLQTQNRTAEGVLNSALPSASIQDYVEPQFQDLTFHSNIIHNEATALSLSDGSVFGEVLHSKKTENVSCEVASELRQGQTGTDDTSTGLRDFYPTAESLSVPDIDKPSDRKEDVPIFTVDVACSQNFQGNNYTDNYNIIDSTIPKALEGKSKDLLNAVLSDIPSSILENVSQIETNSHLYGNPALPFSPEVEVVSEQNNTDLNTEKIISVPTYLQAAKKLLPTTNYIGPQPSLTVSKECAVFVERLPNTNLDIYCKALERQIGPDHIAYIGRAPGDQNKILAFLGSPNFAEKLVRTGINVKGRWLMVSFRSTPVTRVVISDVMPYINDDILVAALAHYGEVATPNLRRIRAATSHSNFKRVFSFRRELYIYLRHDTVLPADLNIVFEGESHKIEISTTGVKCFRCEKFGHSIMFCDVDKFPESNSKKSLVSNNSKNPDAVQTQQSQGNMQSTALIPLPKAWNHAISDDTFNTHILTEKEGVQQDGRNFGTSDLSLDEPTTSLDGDFVTTDMDRDDLQHKVKWTTVGRINKRKRHISKEKEKDTVDNFPSNFQSSKLVRPSYTKYGFSNEINTDKNSYKTKNHLTNLDHKGSSKKGMEDHKGESKSVSGIPCVSSDQSKPTEMHNITTIRSNGKSEPKKRLKSGQTNTDIKEQDQPIITSQLDGHFDNQRFEDIISSDTLTMDFESKDRGKTSTSKYRNTHIGKLVDKTNFSRPVQSNITNNSEEHVVQNRSNGSKISIPSSGLVKEKQVKEDILPVFKTPIDPNTALKVTSLLLNEIKYKSENAKTSIFKDYLKRFPNIIDHLMMAQVQDKKLYAIGCHKQKKLVATISDLRRIVEPPTWEIRNKSFKPAFKDINDGKDSQYTAGYTDSTSPRSLSPSFFKRN